MKNIIYNGVIVILMLQLIMSCFILFEKADDEVFLWTAA